MRPVVERAGVSPATVSRVLTGAPTVRDAYRSRVLAAVAELDYRPNRLARNLRRQRDMIGVVVSDIENPHFSEAVRAVEDAATAAGTACSCATRTRRPPSSARTFRCSQRKGFWA
jgi:LacI family transcriptional regulator